MTTLRISLSDTIKARLESRAAEEGFTSVEQYAEAILLASAATPAADKELEELLSVRAADSRPGIEFTPEFVEQFRNQVRQRRASGGVRA